MFPERKALAEKLQKERQEIKPSCGCTGFAPTSPIYDFLRDVLNILNDKTIIIHDLEAFRQEIEDSVTTFYTSDSVSYTGNIAKTLQHEKIISYPVKLDDIDADVPNDRRDDESAPALA